MSAFQDDFTQNYGVSYYVSVEPVFSEQITDAVTFIARARPENVRASYIAQFSTAALDAAPVQEPEQAQEGEEDDSEDKEEDKKHEEESEEVKQAKRTVFKDVVASIKGLRIEGADREFEGFSNLLLSLLFSLFDPSHPEFSSLVLDLVDSAILTGDRTVSPTLSARYTAVATIFNGLPVPSSTSTDSSSTTASLRLSVLLKLIAYAAGNDDFTVIRPPLSRFVSWLVEWGFARGTPGEEEGNAAVSQVVSALTSKGKNAEARSILLAHLSTPSAVAGSSTSPSSSAAALASETIALSLALPDVFDVSDVAALPSVSVTAPSVPELKKLLDIFQAGDVASFESFANEHGEVLKAHKLDAAALERKLKLLALAELCSNRVGELVSYADIASSLRRANAADDEGEEVETWVIDAIRAGLVSGRLSQPLLSFHVTKAAPRSFTQAHWSQLLGRLQGWRSSLDSILDSVSKGVQVDAPGAIEVAAGVAPQPVAA
ncbi:hypothetical protein T439DRAFT_298640 [Meredithblackwellia eburnea MCA 4105]